MEKNIVLRVCVLLSILLSAPPWASSSPLQRLYVINAVSDSVSVLDPADFHLIADVTTGSRPQDVSVDPQGRYFYVTVLFTRESDDLLEVFDVKTNTLVTSVVTGHQPAHVVPDHAGKRLYVSNKAGKTLTVISVPEFKRVNSIPLKGKGPDGLVISPDDRVLLVPNRRSGDISVVDLARQKVDRIKLPSGAKPVAMGISGDGRLALVTDIGLNQVHKIDVARRAVSGSLSVGKRPMEAPVHPARPFLYIPCMESGEVYKVDLEAWKVDRVIPVGPGPRGIAYSADGRYAYVTLSGEKPNGRVAVLDTDTDRVRTRFSVDIAPSGIAVLFGKNQGW